MKKTQIKKNKINNVFLFLNLCLFFFLNSCGLDEFIIIEDPLAADNRPEISSSFENKHFKFRTNENNSSFFKGTNVYYKIFNSSSVLDYNTIENLISDENRKSEAYNKLINNGYKLLRTENTTDILIPANKNKSYQTVYIRLTDYYNVTEFSAKITIDEVNIGKPVRADGSLSFNFGKTGNNDYLPGTNASIEEKDYNDSKSNGVWYVSLFAVSEGLDQNLSQLHSAPLYLGTIAIEEDVNGN